MVVVAGADVARDQRDRPGADRGDSGPHRAEHLSAETDRADRVGAQPPHHQHRRQPEDRVEREGKDHGPRQRPYFEAHARDRRQSHRDPIGRSDFGNCFEKLGHDSDQLRQQAAG